MTGVLATLATRELFFSNKGGEIQRVGWLVFEAL